MGWKAAVHPEDVDMIETIYDSSFKQRKPFRIEYRLKHNSGNFHWVMDIGRPFYELDGSFGGFIGTCMDINEQKILEESLIVSTEHYKNLFENAHDPILIFKPDGEIILM